jgi:hypothetical protein
MVLTFAATTVTRHTQQRMIDEGKGKSVTTVSSMLEFIKSFANTPYHYVIGSGRKNR